MVGHSKEDRAIKSALLAATGVFKGLFYSFLKDRSNHVLFIASDLEVIEGRLDALSNIRMIRAKSDGSENQPMDESQ